MAAFVSNSAVSSRSSALSNSSACPSVSAAASSTVTAAVLPSAATFSIHKFLSVNDERRSARDRHRSDIDNDSYNTDIYNDDNDKNGNDHNDNDNNDNDNNDNDKVKRPRIGINSNLNEIGAKCRACRLDLCILTGMNTDAMQLPDERDVARFTADLECRKQSLLRRKRAADCDAHDDDDKSDAVKSENQAKKISRFDADAVGALIDALMIVERKFESLRYSNFEPPRKNFSYITIDQLVRTSRSNEIANANKYTVGDMCNTTHGKPTLSISKLRKMLSEKKIPHNLYTDVFLTIELARTFDFFAKLSAQDQVSLLRNVSIVNTILIQCYYSCKNGMTKTRRLSVH